MSAAPRDPSSADASVPRTSADFAPNGEAWQIRDLASFPPMEKWDDWMEYDAKAWPRKVEKHYRLVPTICFNCEAACGLVAYIDKESGRIRRLEGNPHHPASRGRNCAKGPATLNQIDDPERILYPMKRSGPRGTGQFERTTWDEVIDTLSARIRKALQEGRRTEVMYHVGRPGHDGYMDRVLQSWGVDGHNSHTNVCSAAARLGYALWSGMDRPSPDHARAKFILLISSHLETGHYFNPHAQRIVEGLMAGAKVLTIDTRLSNTASKSTWWLSPQPGTEAALLLAFAHVLVKEQLHDREFVRQWLNWREYLKAKHPDSACTFAVFELKLSEHLAKFTPEWAAAECGVPASRIVELAREIGKARGAFAAHVWRAAAAGHLGGWQVARCMQFLSVLTGSMNTVGGTHMAPTNKFVPAPFKKPRPQEVWSELLYPEEYPFSHHELSFLLPHFLKEGRGKLDTYFTRVYNPVWTNPDGGTWMEVLKDESLVGLHAALTPVWSETAIFADYVLPMGVGAERHDIQSQETHAARWIAFRQPVLRVHRERNGEKIEWTYQANPGEVWEEDEFWIRLSWAIDNDGSLGIRPMFESPYRAGQCIKVEEYYRWIFENSVPGLPAAAAKQNLTPLEYMRRYGAFLVQEEVGEVFRESVDISGATLDAERGQWMRGDQIVAVDVNGKPCAGFRTPSKRLEYWSPTVEEWGYGEANALPNYIESHVHPKHMNKDAGEFVLLPNYRLPTLIHTRSGNAKWLYELSNSNPVWVHPEDAFALGVVTGDLIRINTRIGHFVNKVWVTEGIRPGVVACSHHLGRWRLKDMPGTDRWASALVALQADAKSLAIKRIEGIKAFASTDPDSKRVWWSDGGVHQNLTFPVQPDPISGMHCWHQKVSVEKGRPGDRYGDIHADLEKSMDIYREWMAGTRKGAGPGGLRRPLWFSRAVAPAPQAWKKG
ncbi:MAG: formate dehydrogenase [Planctomycetes bacterium]|nr:formate dehydrogenase [Planctomycetota bacterium]